MLKYKIIVAQHPSKPLTPAEFRLMCKIKAKPSKPIEIATTVSSSKCSSIFTTFEALESYHSNSVSGGSNIAEYYTSFEVLSTSRVLIRHMDKKLMDDELVLDLIANELHLLENLPKHENIVEIFSYCSTDLKGFICSMEYVNGCTLSEFVQFHNSLGLNYVSVITKKIIKGADHLHSNGIMHGNMISDNILLSINGDVKIGNFAKITSKTSYLKNRSSPDRSTAPDFCALDFSEHKKLDIWGIGVMVIEMVEGKTPFHLINSTTILRKFSKRGRPLLEIEEDFEVIDNPFTWFLDGVFEANPASSATTSDLLHYRFIQTAEGGTSILVPLVEALKEDNGQHISHVYH